MGMSVHEPTWDKTKKAHSCCGSMHSYHKTSCLVRNSLEKPVNEKVNDPLFIKIQELKHSGMNSGEIAGWLSIPLEKVNDLWLI